MNLRLGVQAKDILKKNKHQYVTSLRDTGYISQAPEDYRQGRYTLTDMTRNIAQEWIQ